MATDAHGWEPDLTEAAIGSAFEIANVRRVKPFRAFVADGLPDSNPLKLGQHFHVLHRVVH